MQRLRARCDYAVYSQGRTVGIYDWTDDRAERFCNLIETFYPNLKADWYYLLGRIVVKVLDITQENIRDS